MNHKTTIQLKATFMLAVFSFNVLIGLGCSFGICTCAADGECREKISMAKMQMCHAPAKATHNEKKGCKGNCCNDNIIKFSKTDKACPQVFTGGNIFFTAFISSFYHIDFLHTSSSLDDIRIFTRSYHPPIADIRTAIRSFQI